jgi:DNA-binding MarR family transcriptional regulator
MDILKERISSYDDEHIMFGTLFLLGNKLQVIGDNLYEEITSKQWFVLLMLGVLGESPTMNELSVAVGSSHQNVKQLVVKLSSKGYVEMYTDENDRRKTRVKTTAKCRELVVKYQEKENEFFKLLYQGIDKFNMRTTIETLMKFEKNMEDLGNGNNRNL